jgi:hypothetical protein
MAPIEDERPVTSQTSIQHHDQFVRSFAESRLSSAISFAAALDARTLVVTIRRTTIFGISPEQKFLVVYALKNDVPALHRADIGIAMGRRGIPWRTRRCRSVCVARLPGYRAALQLLLR